MFPTGSLGLWGCIGTLMVEISYWVGVAYRGLDYATEAVGGMILALRADHCNYQIVAECRSANASSWRVLLKAGFVPSGRPGRREGRELLVLVGPRI